jgi:hypothetical protein
VGSPKFSPSELEDYLLPISKGGLGEKISCSSTKLFLLNGYGDSGKKIIL